VGRLLFQGVLPLFNGLPLTYGIFFSSKKGFLGGKYFPQLPKHQHPIIMGCDFSNPPSYMYSMIGLFHTQGKIRRFTQNIKNRKRIWELSSWIKTSFLDPSSLVD
jgi:hypothetical protein